MYDSVVGCHQAVNSGPKNADELRRSVKRFELFKAAPAADLKAVGKEGDKAANSTPLHVTSSLYSGPVQDIWFSRSKTAYFCVPWCSPNLSV